MATQRQITTNGQTATIVSPPTDEVVGLQLSGTWTGTVQFEASMDNGATFIAIGGYPISGGVATTTVATSATANGNWQFPVGGFTHFRVRASAAMTGTLVVDMETTPGQGLIPFTALSPGTAGPSNAFDVATTITRPANTTPYTAGDVLGGALDLGVLGPSGKAVMIRSAQLEADISAIPAGMTTFTLYLYSVTPPSAVADNGAFDLPAGDRASFLGAFSLGTPADLGSTCYCEATDINKQVKLAGTHLFGYLVTTGGFTPASNSEVYVVTMHTEAL